MNNITKLSVSMKYVFCISLACLLSVHVVAQDSDYRPFVEEGKTWYTRAEPLSVVDDIQKFDYQKHFFQGDTIVAGKVCKKLLQQAVFAYMFPDADSLIAVYMYEEDRKVRFFYEGDTESRLYFDFAAEPGDTLEVWVPDSHRYHALKNSGVVDFNASFHRLFKETIIIDHISREEEGGRMQIKHWYLDKNGGEWQPDSYVMEGVGSIWEPFHNLNVFEAGSLKTVACIMGDEILYLSESFSKSVDIPLPTSITSPRSPQMVNGKSVNSTWLDLSGRRLSSAPTRPGVYLRDGRKVLVR